MSTLNIPPLLARRCQPCDGGTPALAPAQVAQLLLQIPAWGVEDAHLRRSFRFGNHYELMAFVNAVAWVSHREDHHPDISLGYNTCTISYITHSIGGLSDNDFICAAKLDALFAL